MFFIFFLVGAFLISLALTSVVRFSALKLNIQDCPAPPLKNHRKITPLLGGVAIFFTFVFCVLIAVVTQEYALNGDMRIIIGIILGSVWLMLGGVLDDKYNLAPKKQVIWSVLAILTVILFGLGQDNITNPLYYLGLSKDALLHLNICTINVFNMQITLLTDVFTFGWLFLLIYSTKFLDGLNGLVSGIAVIGAMILFFTSIALQQPVAALLSIIVAGTYLGFLPFNFVGKIFLGEAGSTLAGFLLGVLAILGPAKISITFLILGIPILDAILVVYDRLVKRKKSPFKGDLSHLHFKLLNRGLTKRQAVLLLCFVSLCFGVLGLLVQGFWHWLLLPILFVAMVLLVKFANKRVFRVFKKKR